MHLHSLARNTFHNARPDQCRFATSWWTLSITGVDFFGLIVIPFRACQVGMDDVEVKKTKRDMVRETESSLGFG